MAVSSSAATLYLSHKRFPLSTPIYVSTLSSNYVVYPSKPSRHCIRCSQETSVETSAEEADSESSIEVPKGPPSLISALNVERALRGIPITDVDHYGRLGLSRGCSSEQVTDAYRSKTEELTSQGLEEEELNQKLEELKESYSILSTAEERRLYDWSLARSEQPDRYAWPFEVDTTKPPQDEPPAQEPEDVGPTILVGYFILGWLLLSFVLSIALNL
ncbi:DnaJ domain containing protein [Parasponia andersonii]|uniref:DnaJ domain containing protein n=1 Tax=Parasponia andersonii TaxID=3476 RepID=A0A2P5DVQ7_PARAD|nr:DnaJ domain containing protein [Parasponia andersonii]